MKKIPMSLLIYGTVALLLVSLVASAFVGPKLISYITVGFGGEGSKRYSTEGYDTGLEFAPNMFHSEAYETYTQWKPASPFADGHNMQTPPKGTIPRSGWQGSDFMAYHYPNSPEGYDAATAEVKSPLPELLAAMPDSTKRKDFLKKYETKGKAVYEIHCMVCHGEKGDGNGKIVERGKYPTPGAYATKENLTDGKMYHSITYGKNLMGAYASQVTPQERWQVIYYIRKNFLNQ